MSSWLLAVPLGVLIGISLGALGGGGSILTVPALVYVLGESPKQATTTSLVIVGLTALSGAIGHAQARRVRWAPGLMFGLVGVGGSLLGSQLNKHVNSNALLLAFAFLMLGAACAMVLRQRSLDAEAGPSTRSSAASTRAFSWSPRRVLAVVVAGSIVGFMTGFFGVGGGFVVVPGLVLALDFGMAEAVGTSLLVIAINSGAALAARTGSVTLDWRVLLAFTASAIAGSWAGTRIADRAPASTLTRGFAGLLVVVAVYVAIRSVLSLA